MVSYVHLPTDRLECCSSKRRVTIHLNKKTNDSIRIRTVPRLSPRIDDPNSRSHHITMYVNPSPSTHLSSQLTTPSTPVSRLLLLLAANPRHLPNLPLLRTLHGRTRHSTSRLQRQHRHLQHRRLSPSASPSRVLRYLRQSRRWLLVVHQ